MGEGIPAGLTVSTRKLREFGLTVGLAFVVIGLLAWLWRGHPTIGRVLLGGGGVLAVLGLVAPAVLRPIERVWMQMAHLISKVTTPIFLGVMYFVVFAPAGAMRRLAGSPIWKDRSGRDSYWRPVVRSRSMTRQF